MDALPILNALPGNHLILLPDAPHFTIVAVTDACLRSTYTTREAILGKGVFEVFTDDTTNPQATGVANLAASLHHVVCHKQAHYMAEQRYDVINPGRGSFERKVWKLSNQPVLDEVGNLRYIIHTTEDITHQVELMEVTAANQYLQTIINGFKAPLQVLQPIFEDGQLVDFRFKLTNQAYASYANATPQDLQGKRVGEIFPGYFQTESFTNPVQTYQTGQALNFDIHYDQDGLNLYNRMSTARLGEEVVIHFTDFTELRLLQLQLESKIDELKRSNTNLEQFAYVASHDLQEPLRKIQQFGDLLKNGYSQQLGTGIDYLERIQAAARRMSALIKDLLDYSQLTTHEQPTGLVNLSVVLQRVLADLEIVIEQTGAVVDVADLPTLEGDDSQLGQLFQNLLSNALKFGRTDVPPHIQIRCRAIGAEQLPASVVPTRLAPRYYQIDVVDNGIGFEQQYAQRIFQVFQRLHGKNQYAGTGIGLAICERVVAKHGGVITAHSQPGQGATFSVCLPVV